MKQFFITSFHVIRLFISIVLTFIMIVTDRLCRIYRVDKDQPSMHEMHVLEYYRKEVIFRSMIRLLIAVVALILYFTFKFITS